MSYIGGVERVRTGEGGGVKGLIAPCGPCVGAECASMLLSLSYTALLYFDWFIIKSL